MTERQVTHYTSAPPSEVWNVLADGWSYPSWVVGASRMRAVTADYPQPGSKLHHSVGAWPAVLDDETQVLESEPLRLLLLEAKTQPLGRARIRIELSSQGAGTLVLMEEDVSSGPARLIPPAIRRRLIRARNEESLKRLSFLAERAARPAE